MKPLAERVIVQRTPVTEQIGGLIIPDKYRSVPQEGKVVAVGDKVTTVNVGDEVLFGRYQGDQIPGHPDLIVLWEENLMVVLDP